MAVFGVGDEFVGQCEIEDGVIELYWDDWDPVGNCMVFGRQ